MKSFYNFFEAAGDVAGQEPKRVSDDAVTIFGRHQPPHLGHKLTLDRAHDIASSIGDKAPGDQTFYTSRSMDPKKNPLPFQLKQRFLQKMFPEHKDKWDTDENVRTILGAATKAFDKGYKNFHFVGGDDRRQGMEDLLRRYNGNLYNFDNIYSHSAGPRDEEGLGDDPIAKLSASKLRGMAGKGDFQGFLGGMPSNDSFGEDEARQLFDAIQMYSQRNESVEEIRDLYRRERLFLEGDLIECDSTGLVGTVHRRGANHLICVSEDDVMFKCFIDQVTPINN